MIRLFASGFGSGYFPVAPGTAGTLAALPLAWLLSRLSLPLALVIVALLIPVAALICDAAVSGSAESDPGWVVLDEIVGFQVAALSLKPTLLNYFIAFFLFRLFDILKPPPVNWIDGSGRGGWSIVLDDVAAGVYARVALLGIAWVSASWGGVSFAP